jgi:hypothetical protein
LHLGCWPSNARESSARPGHSDCHVQISTKAELLPDGTRA